MELPQPLCLRAGSEAQDVEQLRPPGEQPLSAPGAGQCREGKLYLSQDNYGILDSQLQETYGEWIHDLNVSTATPVPRGSGAEKSPSRPCLSRE